METCVLFWIVQGGEMDKGPQWAVGDWLVGWLSCQLGCWLAGWLFAGWLSSRAGRLASWKAACSAVQQAGKLNKKVESTNLIGKFEWEIGLQN